MKLKFKVTLPNFDGLYIDEIGNLLKAPYEAKGRKYGWRLIKKQKGNRWKIGNGYLSERQLKGNLKPIKNKII